MMQTDLPLPPAPARDWALFLDVDGSLLDFAPRPDDVHVPDDLVDALARLRDALDGALALVSGRPLAQLDALFSPLHLPGAGLHGLELRDRPGATPDLHDAPEALDGIAERAQEIASRHPGALVENKGSTLAFHWRASGAAAAAPEFEALAHEALDSLPHYHLQPGNHVLELRPDGYDKGGAIRHLLETDTFRGRTPVFIGDDLTDEHGFEAVNELGGVSVLVGTRTPTAARTRIDSPTRLRAWLLEAAERFNHNSSSSSEAAA
ncbi:trehalose-phosphatase [Cognatilysobacter bugurensis]|uniref:Trehalose 6-phosphate phosphatase n=1 Tax=Cognatilysobacter bugurensis TaxID=543356 RepID=A0A918SZ96_9GAMM|nr:trehalose-phosphatase [Lysobacter bugurensis]GHA80594.1 trehalose 6-phosphate phosphatase [Lysobacter bugurensis]